MSLVADPYYNLTEVSNSDLGWLQEQLHPRQSFDPTSAYRFGNLIDAMITEPQQVDFFGRRLGSAQFTVEEFEQAQTMKHAFYSDAFCNNIAQRADGQKVMRQRREFNYMGYDFHLPVRCKWDLWREDWGIGGDIKSTAATSQSQFEAAARHFNYDRQRAWYMDIAGSSEDVLIGISKVNFKIFKVFINRQSPWYTDGFAKYNDLSFRWHTMFKEDNPHARC